MRAPSPASGGVPSVVASSPMFELGPDVVIRPTAPAARTIGEMFWLRCARSASLPALHHKPGSEWQTLTWEQFYDGAARVAHGLIAAGLSRGDRVAILGPTQPPWAIQDMGAQLAGMVSFG